MMRAIPSSVWELWVQNGGNAKFKLCDASLQFSSPGCTVLHHIKKHPTTVLEKDELKVKLGNKLKPTEKKTPFFFFCTSKSYLVVKFKFDFWIVVDFIVCKCFLMSMKIHIQFRILWISVFQAPCCLEKWCPCLNGVSCRGCCALSTVVCCLERILLSVVMSSLSELTRPFFFHQLVESDHIICLDVISALHITA